MNVFGPVLNRLGCAGSLSRGWHQAGRMGRGLTTLGSCEGLTWQHRTVLPTQSPPGCRRQSGPCLPAVQREERAAPPVPSPRPVPRAARHRHGRSRWPERLGSPCHSRTWLGTGGSFRWAGTPLPLAGITAKPPEHSQTHGCEGSWWDARPTGTTQPPVEHCIHYKTLYFHSKNETHGLHHPL